jgi:hypothetical protein
MNPETAKILIVDDEHNILRALAGVLNLKKSVEARGNRSW